MLLQSVSPWTLPTGNVIHSPEKIDGFAGLRFSTVDDDKLHAFIGLGYIFLLSAFFAFEAIFQSLESNFSNYATGHIYFYNLSIKPFNALSSGRH